MDNIQMESFVKALATAFPDKGGSDKLSRQEKVEMLKAIASDTAEAAIARKAYAKSRAAVLLPLLDVQSTVRKIFTPEVLDANANATYPISFDYTEMAAFMPKYGGAVITQVEGDEIGIPTFGIEGGARYKIDIARQGRIDVAEESMRLMKNRIVAKEEFAGWRTIKGALSGFNSNQTVYCSGGVENFHSFSKKAINSMYVQMDVQRRQGTQLFVSPRSYGDIREWSQSSIDFLTQREIFQNGGLVGGNIWDMSLNKVYDSTLVADSEAYLFDTKTFGKMPIRQALETYEDPTAILQWEIGVLGRELVGFGVTDSWAIVKASLDSTHTATACSIL